MHEIESERGISLRPLRFLFTTRQSTPSWRSPRNLKEARNWLADVEARTRVYSLRLDSCTEHAGKTRSRGGIAAILSRRVLRERGETTISGSCARIEFLPAKRSGGTRVPWATSITMTRKNGSTRGGDLSARVDREIYSVMMPENASRIVEI